MRALSSTRARARIRELPALPGKPTPPRQALYVNGPDRWTAGMHHGALEFCRAGRPVRRFPLSRIDRIVCGDNVDWRGAALMACMEHGIAVVIEAGRGRAVGYALPTVEPGEPLHACLELLAAMPAATHRLDNWLRHRRMDVVDRWWREYCGAHKSPPGYYYEEVKRRYVYNAEAPVYLRDTLRPICEAYVLARLRRHGALPVYDCIGGTRLSLLDAFTTLIWGEINLHSGALAIVASERQIQLTFLETWFREHDLVIDRHLTALKFFTTRELRPWH